MATVTIEYCYAYRYQELAGVLRQIPGMKVKGVTGKPDSFEVSLGDELIYSKLETKQFPDVEQLAAKVREKVPGGNAKSKSKTKRKCALQ